MWEVFDNHDTWHLLSALGLGVWVANLLDIKLRFVDHWDRERDRELDEGRVMTTLNES